MSMKFPLSSEAVPTGLNSMLMLANAMGALSFLSIILPVNIVWEELRQIERKSKMGIKIVLSIFYGFYRVYFL